MSRNFNGTSDDIITSAGTLSNYQWGTVVVVLRRADTDWSAPIVLHTSGGTAVAGFEFAPSADGNLLTFLSNGGDVTHPSLAFSSSDGWVIAAATKATGTVAPRGHKGVLSSSTWTHSNFSSAIANNSSTVSTVRFGQWETADRYQGEIAAAAVWKSRVLTDTEIESLASGLSAWTALSPDALWRFNQADVTDPVNDLTGNGANQSSRSGTNVDADEPPNWTYDLPSATRALAASITAAGAAGKSTTASSSLSASITSSGAVGRSASASIGLSASLGVAGGVSATASLPLSVGIATTTRLDTASGVSRSLSVALTASGVIGVSSTASMPLDAGIASAYLVECTGSAASPLTVTISASGQSSKAAAPSLGMAVAIGAAGYKGSGAATPVRWVRVSGAWVSVPPTT